MAWHPATARRALKPTLNRSYFRKVKVSPPSLSLSRLLLRDAPLGTPRRSSAERDSRRKVSATSHKHEINFNPCRAVAPARLFISFKLASCTNVFVLALDFVLSFTSLKDARGKLISRFFTKKYKNCTYIFLYAVYIIFTFKRINF